MHLKVASYLLVLRDMSSLQEVQTLRIFRGTLTITTENNSLDCLPNQASFSVMFTISDITAILIYKGKQSREQLILSPEGSWGKVIQSLREILLV